jgi:ATP-dependent protease ClpP protease subunit
MQALYGLRNIADALNIDSRDVLARMGGTTGQKLISAMSRRQPDWYRIVNKAEEKKAEIYLYDEIGWFGTTAGDFVDELGEIDAEQIDVHINSIGGSVFDGIAIFNALRTHDARVVTQVDSAALSIASVIAQAGDERVMVSGSQMMIHEAWGLAIGTAEDMREYAEILERQTDNIAGIYAERVGGSGKKSHFLSLMAGEKWMNADEAVDEKLADRVERPKTADAGPDDESDPGEESTEETEARWSDFIAAASDIEL